MNTTIGIADAAVIALPQAKAARAIGVTDRTLRRWEREGLITGRRVRPGGVKLYPIEQLRQLAQAGGR